MASELMYTYHYRLKELLCFEKQTLKCLAKLSYASLTDELRKGLSPASFDQQQHIDRLKLCLKQVRAKQIKESQEPLSPLFSQAELARKSSRTPSVSRDLQLLHSGVSILNVSQCNYQELYQMAEVLDLQTAAELLEQSWKDVQNACAYLFQISANIIYPAATGETPDSLKQKST
jgi:ferritin-like metal-binding protein YciE